MYEPRLGVQVGEMQADRRRLEDEAMLVLQYGDPPQGMAGKVLVALALLPGHDRDLVRLSELLEHPHDANRAPRVLAMKDPQHVSGR